MDKTRIDKVRIRLELLTILNSLMVIQLHYSNYLHIPLSVYIKKIANATDNITNLLKDEPN